MVLAPAFLGALPDAPTAAPRCCERMQMSVVISQLPIPWPTQGPPALDVGLLLLLLLLLVVLIREKQRSRHRRFLVEDGDPLARALDPNRRFANLIRGSSARCVCELNPIWPLSPGSACEFQLPRS
jgi:hypothetical protein